ncbi:putative calcium/calmodulin dependent protein kinase [Aspergillus saccharolyticus JOP 1030-1]|uniref:Calcium/calmodulin-dependent protein kinase n=1 Tax=Aspergillus saccharolyticus JOP 1030-1 TaxID=1450539 RepID=A0A318Z020_9EURO|nr:calcium/calmodulin-dependent protein kinase [Aspergillus saccharolyticus JOP 1030-1]PYH40316.1 calcium/calmodulin-dependent protein kinase [Aspergillus saccharolyticus JOP 1030-1]
MARERPELIQQPPMPQPCPFRSASTPSYGSPQRHHRRNPIVRRPVKETLDARSEYTTSQDDGTAEHRINQYVIKQEIGRGSFGAVHLAVDQFGNEYAVKEFSKARLRRRAQSHLLRRPRGPKRPSDGLNAPLHCHSAGVEDQKQNALYLIKEEIAIMKKLNHNNLVSLIEVLDDPTQDSLYIVMEMCKKGVVMKVSLEERADPYDDALCRCWFRDLILGIEYLHAQGIVHRDIKPDNCLVTNDDVLKVVDFGVSEMFEKDSNMYTAKSAGSPAFLPPELCVVKHGDVSGKAADIWSMGVTLYCLRYGKLPFEKQSIFELYEAIKNDAVVCEGETDDNFRDLISRILDKDPTKRIQMHELREHPWVTQDGLDPLLPESENTAEIIDLPTEEEMNSAITRTIGHVMAVIKAVKHFKRLLGPAKADPSMQSILGQEYEAHFVEPPLELEPEESFSTGHTGAKTKNRSLNTYSSTAWGQHHALKGNYSQPEELPDSRLSDTPEVLHTQESTTSNIGGTDTKSEFERRDSSSLRSINVHGGSNDDLQLISMPQSPSPLVPLSRASSATTKRSVEGTRGHARDPLEEEFPFLFIGPSTYSGLLVSEGHETLADNSIPEEPGSPVAKESVDMVNDMHTNLDTDMAYPVVSESPGAAEFDIYEIAYRQEIERIRAHSLPRQGSEPKVYLTRRVEGKDDVMKLVGQSATRLGPMYGVKRMPGPSLASAVSAIRLQLEQQGKPNSMDVTSSATATGITATEAMHTELSASQLRDILD